MALNQQKFREIVLQILYSYDMGSQDDAPLLHLLMQELAIAKSQVKRAHERASLIRNHTETLDALIASVSVTYEFNRIQVVTKNILRLCLYELLFDQEVPPKVAIAEAIRLSRKFSNRESAAFVNAVLDTIYQQQQGRTPDTHEVAHTAHLLTAEEIHSASLAQQIPLNPEEDDPFVTDDVR